MNKTLPVAFSMLVLTGCQVTPENMEPASQNSSVIKTDEVFVQVSQGSVFLALQKLANESGLTLNYQAEHFSHSLSGNLTGRPETIAKQITNGHPVRAYKWGNELVVEQRWILSKGTTLKDQLAEWDKQSHWSVVWNTRKNQNLLAPAEFYGSFDHAVEQLFKSVRNDGSELEPEFYPNNTVVVR